MSRKSEPNVKRTVSCDRVRVVVEQPEALVQAVVVQEAVAADADRARLGD